MNELDTTAQKGDRQMAKSKRQRPEELEPPVLMVTRKEASEKIQAQIVKGKSFLSLRFQSPADIDKTRSEESKWSAYNMELLKRIFSNTSVANEYNYSSGYSFPVINPTFPERVESFLKSVQDSVTKLEAIYDRLELFPEPSSSAIKQEQDLSLPQTNEIFIVHGHDITAKDSVARFLERLNIKPIILHELPNAGRTIIEKFLESSNVSFAIVLMTPDDVGATSSSPDKLSPRARQNVIFELGYFVGSLGRNRVCALHKADVQLPSDWDGVLYIPMDDTGAWKLSLAREIKHTGFGIDLNKVL